MFCLIVSFPILVFSNTDTVSWLVGGTNKSYVIATSDLWLFIHASNLLSLNSPPYSPTLQYSPSFPRQLPMCGVHVRLYKHRVGYVGQPRSMVYLTSVVCHTVYIYVCVCSVL